ncbi:hypothetical protein ACIQU1_23105 [Streptomyces angustmyceticus]|uniref:hypothetical protein n=1 Tax=Streptomyces angustmyceticus TaxID=285578 RepID=UPI0037FE444D
MQQHSIHPWPRAKSERNHSLRKFGGHPPGRRCAEAAYPAFCLEHHSLYSQFAAAVTGSTSSGRRLARAALEELAAQWLAALRSPSPSGFAWALLADTIAPYRTGSARTLYRNFHVAEADALLLRHRLGCSVTEAGRVMGMSPDAFELLWRRALMNATNARHMPASDAI